VAEVAVADGADDFGADSAAGDVWACGDVLSVGRVVEGWPAAVGIEFFFGGEEEGVAAGAVVGAFALFFEFLIDFAAGCFGSCLAEDAVLFGG
jgi:hypothetical protein